MANPQQLDLTTVVFGKMLGITFPIHDMFKWSPAFETNIQQEDQVKLIYSLLDAKDVMIESRRNVSGTGWNAFHFASWGTTRNGLYLTMSRMSWTWAVTISCEPENIAKPSHFEIQVWDGYYACSVCNQFDKTPHEHDSFANGCHVQSDRLWRFSDTQRSDLGIILECLTYQTYNQWRKVIDEEANKQQIARAYAMAPKKTSCDLFLPLPPMPRSKA